MTKSEQRWTYEWRLYDEDLWRRSKMQPDTREEAAESAAHFLKACLDFSPQVRLKRLEP